MVANSITSLRMCLAMLPGAYRNPKALESVLKYVPNLQRLDLWSPTVHPEDFQFIPVYCSQLTSLFL